MAEILSSNMNSLGRFLLIALFLGAIVLFGYLLILRIDTFLKDRAIDECAKISKFEKNLPDENAKVSYPVIDIFNDCLKRKGI